MTSKERLRKAFKRGVPDRVPVGPMINPGWLALAGKHTGEFIRKVDVMMDIHVCTEPELYLGEGVKDAMERTREGDKVVEIIHTPGGDLTSVVAADRNMLGWVVKRYLETADDIKKLLSFPYKPLKPDLTVFRQWEANIGDEGVVMPLIYNAVSLPGLWMPAEKFMLTCLDDFGFVKELLEIASARVNEYVDTLCRAGIRCFRIAGPELASQTLMGPGWFEKLVSPYDESLNRVIHRYDGIAFCHCHGKIKNIISQIADAGFDVLSPVEEPPSGNITMKEAKQAVGDRMCLSGNIDEMEFLGTRRKDEIERKCIELIQDAGKGGGLVLGGTESGVYTEEMLQGFLIMAEVAGKYGRYNNVS